MARAMATMMLRNSMSWTAKRDAPIPKWWAVVAQCSWELHCTRDCDNSRCIVSTGLGVPDTCTAAHPTRWHDALCTEPNTEGLRGGSCPHLSWAGLERLHQRHQSAAWRHAAVVVDRPPAAGWRVIVYRSDDRQQEVEQGHQVRVPELRAMLDDQEQKPSEALEGFLGLGAGLRD